ncbi:hypothetical protein RN001_004172 [Aquatica leii]|uniref:Retropepsins domain-containing protein n=1 Tax=Aquatica leii TaxID=1421715 RepID=A0AAN7PBB9_9COLE|nr:hypothetical protein RN001_004172 [Aquatica leii]
MWNSWSHSFQLFELSLKTSAEAFQTSSESSFCELDAKKFPSLQRPILPIQIWDSNGTAIADTGATRSVAGETLYNLLKNRCCFTRQNFSVTLADGTDTPQEVLTTTVPIQIAHKTITVEMIVLPNAKSNRTLLGIDFLSKARVLLNTADQTWCFIENPEMPFSYATETRIDGSLVESSTSVDNVSFTSLREDEGTMLNPDQRRSFNSFLTKHETTFRPGGEPTDYAEHRIKMANLPDEFFKLTIKEEIEEGEGKISQNRFEHRIRVFLGVTSDLKVVMFLSFHLLFMKFQETPIVNRRTIKKIQKALKEIANIDISLFSFYT